MRWNPAKRTIAALIILLAVVVAWTALTHRAPAQTRTGAFVDPSLCQESSPTPPFLTHGGVYRDRLDARGRPVCYAPGGLWWIVGRLFGDRRN